MLFLTVKELKQLNVDMQVLTPGSQLKDMNTDKPRSSAIAE